MVKRKYSERPCLLDVLLLFHEDAAGFSAVQLVGRRRTFDDASVEFLGHGLAGFLVGLAERAPGGRPLGQVGDLLDQIDRAHHQPRLGVVVQLARVVHHADVAGHVQLGFVLVGDAHVVGAPGDAAGEVADLDGNLAGHAALDVPLQGVVAAAGKRRVDQIDLVLLVEDAEVDARRIDQRIGPGELHPVDALLDRQQPVLADHRDVFRVVDGQLRPLPARNGHQIDCRHTELCCYTH